MRAFLVVTTALAAISFQASAETSSHHHWDYEGHDGPSHWAKLDPAYRACGTGRRQSPIDIHQKTARRKDLPALIFQYQSTPIEIVDNGHTVQVNYAPGNALLIGSKRYELIQFHFHHPAEEAIDGKHFDMVAHLVHRNSEGELAVVAVPLKQGHENPLIAALWNNLPKKGAHEPGRAKIDINASDLLPSDHSYYAYSGSLTTPPCSEGVRWSVLEKPMEISKAQIAAFAERYPDDARPVQRLNGREVFVSK